VKLLDELRAKGLGSRQIRLRAAELMEAVAVTAPDPSAREMRDALLKIPDGGWDAHCALQFLALELPPELAYLEVGVLSGGSLVQVASTRLASRIMAVDEWSPDLPYASRLRNWGPEVPARVVLSLGHRGVLRIEQASSHDFLPWLACRPSVYDLALVDGDHTLDGAERDLRDAWPLVKPGGYLVFDDLNFVAYDLVRAPKEEQRKLCEVWRRFLA
jgi:hypothetical protein